MPSSEWRLPRKVNAGGDVRKVWHPRATVWRAGKAAASNPNQREVIVRISRRTKSVRAMGSQFLYLTRNAALPGEHSSGRTLAGVNDLRELRDRWARTNAAYGVSQAPTQTLGVVLSMPPGTPLTAVVDAARTWAQEHLSPRTEWFMVPHADQAAPHAHVAVRSVQNDGRRISAGPAEVQAWRVAFADGLQAQGIEADATPRHEKVERILAQQRELDIRLETAPQLRL